MLKKCFLGTKYGVIACPNFQPLNNVLPVARKLRIMIEYGPKNEAAASEPYDLTFYGWVIIMKPHIRLHVCDPLITMNNEKTFLKNPEEMFPGHH